MLARGQTQQQSVEIFLKSEEIELARRGEHRTVVIVLISVKVVVGGVEFAQSLEQLHLGQRLQLAEHLDGLGRGGLVAVDGHVGIDHLLHVAADEAHIVERHGPSYLQVNIIAVRHGDVDAHLAVGKQVVGCLAEPQEERARVGPGAAGRGDVEKLHLLGIIHAVVHALYLVVDAGADGSVLQL